MAAAAKQEAEASREVEYAKLQEERKAETRDFLARLSAELSK